MTEESSFGSRAATLSGARELLDLERSEGRAERFAALDALVGDVVTRTLHAERVVESERGRNTATVSLAGLAPEAQKTLLSEFSLEAQHAKGSWFIPEKVSLKTGLANLPWSFANYPRYASGIVWEEKASVLPLLCPDSVAFWAVFQPLFEQLFAPFELRGRLSGTRSAEDQLAIWAAVDAIVDALGFEVDDELAVMRYGAGWWSLRGPEQLAAKQRLLEQLAAQASVDLGARYRAARLASLVERYYSRAKGGTARRKSVLTKPLERTLSGFFGGDWLAFLHYIGEAPHPDEEIATAIPAPEIFVGGAKDATAVAADLGLPADEVQRALATFWATTEGSPPTAISPVEERVVTLKAYWSEFDAVHAHQAPGMKPLYGLVELTGSSMESDWVLQDGRYSPRCYLDLLSPALLDDIERMWGSTMLARWPDRIVTEISPHAGLAGTFGRALRFWHEVALTTWYLAEGPYAVTDTAGLAERHAVDLEDLAALGCPVDSILFPELIEGEAKLGPEEPVNEQQVSPAFSLYSLTRRPGFEILRDIVTRHRRAWAERYLDPYIKSRWDSELREAARHHAEAIAAKGKPPTPKQFARFALTATNHWLGGDISAFYAAIGEKSAVHPERISLMPLDRTGFAHRVFDTLGGRHFVRQIVVANRDEGLAQAAEQDRHNKSVWLASQSLRVVQLEEAMGRAPELKEFGTPAFAGHADVIDFDVDHAWQRYVSTIDAVRGDPGAAAPVTAEDRMPLAAPEAPVLQTAATPPPARAESSPPPRPSVSPFQPPSPPRPPAEEHHSWFRRRQGR